MHGKNTEQPERGDPGPPQRSIRIPVWHTSTKPSGIERVCETHKKYRLLQIIAKFLHLARDSGVLGQPTH